MTPMDKSLNERLATANPMEKIHLLNEQAWALSKTDTQQAAELSQHAYDLAQKVNGAYGIAHSLSCLARIHHYEGNNNLALTYALDAVSRFKALSVVDLNCLEAHATLGMVYQVLNSYDNAFAAFLELLKLARQTEDIGQEFVALTGLGLTYSKLGKTELSLDYFDQSLKLGKTLNDLSMMGASYHNAAIEFNHKKDHTTALSYALRALEVLRTAEFTDAIVATLVIIGETHHYLGNKTQALVYFQKAIEEAKTLAAFGLRYSLQSHLHIGQIILSQAYYDDALPHIETALELAEKTASKEYQYQAHELLATLFEQQGKPAEALMHYKAFHALKEDVFNHQMATDLSNLMVVHQTETARQEAEGYKRQNEMLEKLRDQERQIYETMSQMKDDLIHTASHDLKNPLTNIMLSTYFLRHKVDTNDPLYAEVIKIERQVDQMRLLITNLLDLATIEASPIVKSEKINLNAFLEEIVSEFQPQANQRSLTLRLSTPHEPILLGVSAERMRSVFQNLLSNSLKYTLPGGQIDVQLELVENRQAVRISVSDTGIGIPSEDQAYIFDKFYRVRKNDHLSVEGTGIGLAIVKRIIEQYDGKIMVRSNVGSGATFDIVLPILTMNASNYASR